MRELAQIVGVTTATLSRIENGHNPDFQTFGRLCRWFDEDPRRFLGIPCDWTNRDALLRDLAHPLEGPPQTALEAAYRRTLETALELRRIVDELRPK